MLIRIFTLEGRLIFQETVEQSPSLKKNIDSGDFNGDGLTDVMAFEESHYQNQYYLKESCFEDNHSHSPNDSFNRIEIAEPTRNRCYARQRKEVESRKAYLIELDRRKNNNFLIPMEDNSSQFTLLTNTGKDFISKTKNFSFVFKKSERKTISKRINFFRRAKYVTDFYYSLIPIDINGDGKTDIIDFNTTRSSAYKEEDTRSITIYENSYDDLAQNEVFF